MNLETILYIIALLALGYLVLAALGLWLSHAMADTGNLLGARYCGFFWEAYRLAKDNNSIKPRDSAGHNWTFSFVKSVYRFMIFSGMSIVGPFLLLVALLDFLAIRLPFLRHEYEAEKMYPPLVGNDGRAINLGHSDEGHDVTSTPAI